jgi:hypothetical protein
LCVLLSSYSQQSEYTSTLWALLARLGWDFLDELNGTKIHRQENVMTMDTSTHRLFDALEWYFEKTASIYSQKPKTLMKSNSSDSQFPTNTNRLPSINTCGSPSLSPSVLQRTILCQIRGILKCMRHVPKFATIQELGPM